MNHAFEVQSSPELDANVDADSAGYFPLPEAASPEEAALFSGMRGALLVASAVCAAGITSLWVFHRPRPAPEAAPFAPRPSVRPSPAARPAGISHRVEAGPPDSWNDPLVPFGSEAKAEAPAAPVSAVVQAPTPVAASGEPPQEPMIERSRPKPRLRLLESFVAVAKTTDQGDGFRLLRVDDSGFAAGAQARAADRSAVEASAAGGFERAAFGASAARGAAAMAALGAVPAVPLSAIFDAYARNGITPMICRQGTSSRSFAGVNTSDEGWALSSCAATEGCTAGRDAAGELVLRYADPKTHAVRTWTHGYDQSAPLGCRNDWKTVDAGGNAAEGLDSPLVFDLKGRGVRVSDRVLRYDIDGDGRVDLIRDVATTAGVLVFDADRDGAPGSSGRGLFGTSTDLDGDGRPDGFKDGFEAFRAFVERAVRQGILSPGVLRERRLGPSDLSRLEKAYGLGMKVGSLRARALPLRAAGVSGISLPDGESRLVGNFDGQGNAVLRMDGATFERADGSRGTYEDVFFRAERLRFRPMADGGAPAGAAAADRFGVPAYLPVSSSARAVIP